MKKILAGVLAAASMLTMTVSASATSSAPKTTQDISAAGEVEYDVPVTAPKIVLNLVMPAKMEAALNPYGAQIKLDATPTEVSNGIASAAYTITNKSTDYGVWIDATATTTVETADKDKWTVDAVKGDGVTKGAALSLLVANSVNDLKDLADGTTMPVYDKAADDGSGNVIQGALKLNSTVVADKTAGVAAGQTKQKKMMFVPANDGANDGEAVMAFIGELETGDDIEWTEEDVINVALILKVSAGAKTIDGSSTSTPPATGNAQLANDAVTLTGFTGVTWAAGTTSYTTTFNTSGSYAIQIDPSKLSATQTVTLSATSDDTGLSSGTTRTITSGSTAGNQCKTTMDFGSNGDGNGQYVEFTVKIDDSSDSSTTTYTVLAGTKS